MGNMKTRLLREAAMFYFGICSGGSSTEYITIAKTLCKEYPELKDKKPVIEGEYWVSFFFFFFFVYKVSALQGLHDLAKS